MIFYEFCPHCAARLDIRVRGGLERPWCASCDRIFYRNPTVGVAVIVLEGERILLGRRARGPYAGLWCIPCGHVEWDEDIRDAARREFLEETGLEVVLDRVYEVHSNFHEPDAQTVGVWFLGRVTGGELRAADDLDHVGYHFLGTLPDLAYETDRLVMARLAEEFLGAVIG